VCEGTLNSWRFIKGYWAWIPSDPELVPPQQVLLKYLVQPKGIVFTNDFTKVFFVANYSVMASDIDLDTIDGAPPNVTDLKVIATKAETGLVAPYGLAVDACEAEQTPKVYWSDMCTGKIQRSDFDGNSFEDVITGASGPSGLSILCYRISTTTTTTGHYHYHYHYHYH
jgi:hypothetical protein